MRKEIQIFTTTDIHGRLVIEKDDQNNQSLAQLASLLKEKTRNIDRRIYIDNGDTIQGSPLVHYFGKKERLTSHPMVAALDYMGCDVAVIGNHEFNYGYKQLQTIISSSDFPWLSANIVDPISKKVVLGKPYQILNIDGVKIAILGLSTRVSKTPVSEVYIEEELKTLAYWLPRMKGEAQFDVLIVAYHGGTERDLKMDIPLEKPSENKGLAMLAGFPEIDILISGHQHRYFAHRQGHQAIIQAGAFAGGLGEIKVSMEEKTGQAGYDIVSIEPIIHYNDDYEEDPEFLQIISPFEDEARYWREEVVACLDQPLIINNILDDVCIQEHPLMQWVHDVQRKAAGVSLSVASFVNEGFGGFLSHQVTRDDIMHFFPYPDSLAVVSLSGKDLRQMIEKSAGFFHYQPNKLKTVTINPDWMQPHFRIYDYQMWKGIDYTYDLRRPPGKRLVEAQIAGQALEDTEFYHMVVSAFIANQIEHVFSANSLQNVRNIETELPDLLMKDAADGGLSRITIEKNRQIIYE